MRIVVHTFGLGLIVQRHVRGTVRTQRRRLVVDAEVLLQLPTAGKALRFCLADGLGQHEGAEDAQQLHEGNCDGACGDQHRTLADDEGHAVEAALLEDLCGAIRSADVAGAAVGQSDRIVTVSRKDILPVLTAIHTAALELKDRSSIRGVGWIRKRKRLTNSCIMSTESLT